MTTGDERFMALALEEARRALRRGEVPVGAVLVDAEGAVLARAHNRTVTDSDPTAHAEILCLRKGASLLRNERLVGTTLYATLEPCCMCAGAAVWSRVGRIVFGAADEKAGAAGSLYRIPEDSRLNHRIDVRGGVLEEECRRIVQEFFRARRP